MITKETIDRITALSKKQRSLGLSPEEKAEQEELRRLYIEHIKTQVRSQLEDCNSSSPASHTSSCSCGCRHPHGHKH